MKWESALRNRVQGWLDASKQMIIRCPTCEGYGKIRSFVGGAAVEQDCSYCVEGRKVSVEKARRALLSFRSPAGRADPRAVRAAEESIARMYRDPPPAGAEAPAIGGVEFTGAIWARVQLRKTDRHAMGGHLVSWILLSDPSTQKPQWYLWTEGADPEWGTSFVESPTPTPEIPDTRRSPAASPPASALPSGAPAPEAVSANVRRLLVEKGAPNILRDCTMDGKTAVLRLFCPGVTDESELQDAISRSIIPATQAAMEGLAAAQSVRLEFHACYRDRFGNVEARPYHTAQMDRPVFQRIVFKNLEQEEALALFNRADIPYRLEGVKLWWRDDCSGVAPAARSPEIAPSPATSARARPSVEVLEALRWLAAHQSPDGGWECEGFPRWCDGLQVREGPSGVGKGQYDVGVTGLAVLAFLRAGFTSRSDGPFGIVVSTGLQYLKANQDADGCFGSRALGHYVYNHAIATGAMVEACGTSASALYRGAAQKGLDFIAIARNPYFAWRYGIKPGDNDTSVTGWMMMALRSAKVINQADLKSGKPASLQYDEEAFDGIKAWVEKMTDPDYGRVGYQQRGTGPARPTELVDKFPADKSESMTAVGLLARIFFGEAPDTSEPIEKGAELCAKIAPRWNPNDGSIDMYYWYYGTLAMRHVGGARWVNWKAALKAAVLGAQRSDGEYCLYKGSWDPVDPWGPEGGRVYATSILALCLEATER